jgi:hypothetical protein
MRKWLLLLVLLAAANIAQLKAIDSCNKVCGCQYMQEIYHRYCFLGECSCHVTECSQNDWGQAMCGTTEYPNFNDQCAVEPTQCNCQSLSRHWCWYSC